MTSDNAFVGFLRRVLEHGGAIALAQFSLNRGLLQSLAPTYSLTLSQGEVLSFCERRWNSELEEFLLSERRQQTASEDDEAERFAAILLNNLANAAATAGKDYAEAVFVELLRDGDPALATTLARCPTYAPSRGGQHYASTRAFLEHSLVGARNSLATELRYPDETARSIHRAAVSLVLDETFHISARDALFPPGG